MGRRLPSDPNSTGHVLLCLSGERWEEKWVTLWISASIFEQRNLATQVAGTIRAHQAQRWVAVRPDCCLPATVSANNAGVRCCYLSQYTCRSAFAAGLSSRIKPTCQNPPVLFNAKRHFRNGGTAKADRFWAATTSRTGETPLSKEHINLAPGEVTVNEVPSVAGKSEVGAFVKRVVLRCPSGRAPGVF